MKSKKIMYTHTKQKGKIPSGRPKRQSENGRISEKLSGKKTFRGWDSGENFLWEVTVEVKLSGKGTEDIRHAFCPDVLFSCAKGEDFLILFEGGNWKWKTNKN